jgi:hypothetical protein
VSAQQRYAKEGHDGRPAGAYAMTFASDPGKQNGLYWPATRGQRLSPLGEMIAQAAEERASAASSGQRSAFQGYYFRILTSQGPAAAGGAKNYVVNGVMSGGFALVAWPAQYGATGVMTFLVNQDGVVFEKDLGKDSHAAAEKMAAFNIVVAEFAEWRAHGEGSVEARRPAARHRASSRSVHTLGARRRAPGHPALTRPPRLDARRARGSVRARPRRAAPLPRSGVRENRAADDASAPSVTLAVRPDAIA